jgi:hypothetical protein
MTDTYDSPWKEILEGYFADFMAFFFPEAYADIDWARGYESLDQELQQIVRDAALGRRLADKLMRVWRRNGETQMVLVHTEIQGEREPDFPKRMYTYNYRLFDRYDRPVVSLAILGDDSPGWRPDRYHQSLWGCQVGFQFPVIKLHDYREQGAMLEASANPFAIVVMAHLQTRATRTAPEARLHGKMRLVRHLYGRGYQREDVLELFRFIDWVMALPADLEKHFRDELTRFEAETHMPYITSIERMGIEKGIHQGETLVLRRQLTRRFGPLPAWVEQRLEEASLAQLEAWAERVLEAARLEEVFETP